MVGAKAKRRMPFPASRVTAVKGRKQIPNRCNYKAAVATKRPVRNRTEHKETLGACTVLVPRSWPRFIGICADYATFPSFAKFSPDFRIARYPLHIEPTLVASAGGRFRTHRQ